MEPLGASNGTTLSHTLLPLKMNAQFIGKPFQSWLLESSDFDGTNHNSVSLRHGTCQHFPHAPKWIVSSMTQHNLIPQCKEDCLNSSFLDWHVPAFSEDILISILRLSVNTFVTGSLGNDTWKIINGTTMKWGIFGSGGCRVQNRYKILGLQDYQWWGWKRHTHFQWCNNLQRAKMSSFNPNWQLSTAQPLAHSPLPRCGRESEG